MPIVTSYNATVSINNVDLTAHTNKATVNYGEETRELRIMGNAYPVFRAGLSTPSIELTFYANHTNGTVEPTLRGLISITSTGYPILVRYQNAIRSTDNQEYAMDGILDGDLNVMDDESGEVAQITARFLPYSYFNVYTSTT